MEEKQKTTKLIVPNRLISKIDLGRVAREMNDLDDSLHQASIRSSGKPVQLPRTTRMLEDLAELNKLSLLEPADRKTLIERINEFGIDPPIIHISFTVEPSAAFVEKIIVWLRANIHPALLLDIGLQPTITAGCVVRTRNKIFDMSLRENLAKMTPMLLEKIGGPT